VRGLLGILERMIDRELEELDAQGVQLRHVGRIERLPARLKEKVRHAIDLTEHNERLILNVAFNYGGRAEIVDAVRRIVAEGFAAEQIDEELIDQYLYTAGLPDPDLIVRTSGEMRMSNFLIWQAAYAEFYTTPTLWPDFDRDELYQALQAYNQRDRRFGVVLN
jgi:undecaprenyl diphosphate synthase